MSDEAPQSASELLRWERRQGGDDADGDDEPEEPKPDEEADVDDSDFDAAVFVARTPMEDVVEDIESGDYDEHLDEIEEAADRQGVQDAIAERRD